MDKMERREPDLALSPFSLTLCRGGFMATIPVKDSSTHPPETVEQRFHRLANEWQTAVAHHSSTSLRNNHPAYRDIIHLGPEVVPFLLRDLEVNNTHWFSALREITGANPLPESAAGNVPQMVEAWLRWAKDHGYQW